MSKTKRPTLDLSAFHAVAVKQADPVAAVRTPPATPKPAPEAVPPKTKPKAAATKNQAPSRRNRVQIMGWFAEETRTALRVHALENGKTLEQVMGESFADYLARKRVSK
jgi:hypothetical protein